MRSNRLLALTLAAALTFSVAACSSGDSAKAPTKAVFLKKADAICKAGDDKVNKISEKVDGTDEKAMKAFFVTASTESLGQITAVRALGFPKGDEAKLDKALGTFETTFTAVKKDPTKTQELLTDKELTTASKTLRTYGLKECGTDS